MPRVKDIMTMNPKTCMLDHNLTCALKIMRDYNCGAVPIVDEDNRIHGIVTDRDIALHLMESLRSPYEVKIKACVKNLDEVITIKPEDEMHRAVSLMEEHQVRRLPVCDEKHRVVGIVAQADIALKDPNVKETAELLQEVSKARKETIGANP